MCDCALYIILYGIAWTMMCLAEASYLLRIIMFLRIAYGLGNLFDDIRGETSACAQDGPLTFPKRTGVSVLCTLDLSHA